MVNPEDPPMYITERFGINEFNSSETSMVTLEVFDNLISVTLEFICG